MRTLTTIICVCLSLVLSGCAAPITPVEVPVHPLYVFAGQRAVPGHAHAEVSIVDRTSLKPIGTRTLALSYIREALYDGSNLW